MLTLGLPPKRDPRALFEALVWPRGSDAPQHEMVGPAVVTMSLEVDPSALDLTGLDRLSVDVPPDLVDDVLSLRLRPALTVFSSVDSAGAIAAAGHTPGLSMAEPISRQADFLAVVAHTEGGFVARASTPEDVLSIVSGTVAALRGDDIRAGLLRPDVDKLMSMHPDAAAATRTVLLGIECDCPAEVVAALDPKIAGARGRTT